MRFEFKPSLHVRTAYPEFYEQMKKEGYVDTYHQLFTYAVMVGVKAICEGKSLGSDLPKTGDLFMVQNITDSNLEILTGVVAQQCVEITNAEDLFKWALDVGDHGVSILKSGFAIDNGNLMLNDFIE